MQPAKYQKNIIKIVWCRGGEEKTRMLSAVTDKLQVLKPSYIRIDHIYDFYNVVKKDSSGILLFDWSNLDKTIDDILSVGAKPFISISYMPDAISRGNDLDMPLIWEDWQYVVQRTVEHISGVNSRGIKDVYYEVWNEPDLFGGFLTYGDKNYLDIYKNAILGASVAQDVHEYKIGGPATTSYYNAWFKNLLNLRRQGYRLDFLSWHKYSEDINDYLEDTTDIKEFSLEYPELVEIEKVISESGINSGLDSRYDSLLGAIHSLALAASLSTEVDMLCHFEIKDGPAGEMLSGKHGILTNEKYQNPTIKKRYSAIEFLNRMKGELVLSAGNGTWIKSYATSDNGVLRILIVNYDTKDVHTEKVPLTVENLSTASYKLTRYDFQGGDQSTTITTDNGRFKDEIPMAPNSAAILEFIPN